MKENGLMKEAEMDVHILWEEFCDVYDTEPGEMRLWYKVDGHTECILREKEQFERMIQRVRATKSKVATLREERSDEWQSPK
jgi:hypothetical protein